MKKLAIFLLAILPLIGMGQTTNVRPIADNPPGPFLTLTPTSIGGLASTSGTLGTSQGYNLAWNQWTASADTITTSAGFVVSVDNLTFTTSVIINTPGTSGIIPLYVALAAGNSAGSYSGNVTHTSGPVVALLPVSGATAGVPSLSVLPTSLSLTDTVGTPGFPGTLTATFSFLTGSVNVTVPTAPAPLELSQDGGTTWAPSLSFNSGSPKAIKARVTTAASQGSFSDTIAFASSGVSTVKIPINVTVSNPSGVHIDTVVIPAASVTSNLTNFPMVFNETKTAFKTVGNGGSVQNSNGYDITFSTDAAGSSLLNWEVETYNPSTGQLVAWIKMPTLSSSTATTIYMRYNQPSISTFQGGSAGAVWDANYTAVWHMNQQLTASGQLVNDYTTNGNNLTSFGTWTSGQQISGPVGLGLKSLKANSDYLQWAPSGIGGLVGDFTAEIWANITVADQTSFTFGSPSFANDLNFFSGFHRLYNGSDAIVDGTATPINTWVHLVVTRSGNNIVAYHNGISTATATQSSGFTYNFQNLFISLTNSSSDISADEPRLSNIARTGPWIAAEYLDMNQPDVFYTYKPGH